MHTLKPADAEQTLLQHCPILCHSLSSQGPPRSQSINIQYLNRWRDNIVKERPQASVFHVTCLTPAVMMSESRAGFKKKTRVLLMKYHEIIHDDNYVIMAQLGISPV